MAKSSAESELYGVVKGACEAVGVRTSCHDIGWDLDLRLELDVTSAKGILDRQGISKVRIHSTPRDVKFDPWQARNGPGRKRRSRPFCRTIGVLESGGTFDMTDD